MGKKFSFLFESNNSLHFFVECSLTKTRIKTNKAKILNEFSMIAIFASQEIEYCKIENTQNT